MREQLDELEQRLRAFGAPIAGAFRPGAAPERIRAALEEHDVPAHEELVEWWSWHDGAVVDAPPIDEGPGIFTAGENTLLEPWHVVSLDEALRIRRWFRDEYEGVGLAHLLPETWVPLAVTEGRPVLFADGTDASLHVLDEGQLEAPPALFASLTDFVGTVVRAFDDGAVEASPMDERAPAAAAARLSGDLRRLAFF